MVTLDQLQNEARLRLEFAGIEMAALDARVIIQHELDLSHEAFIAEPGRLVTATQSKAVNNSLVRRLNHEPVSRIIGEREFYGRRFTITPDVLDPRPDTETVIDQVLDIIQAMGPRQGRLQIADIGTGSGAIIATLLAELSQAAGTATDISPAALAVAQRNAEQLAVADRITFVQTSWLEGLRGRYDVIASNPPYIESRAIEGLAPDVARFDPLMSLDGGLDGLEAYRAIVPQAFEHLADGGYLCVEIGAGQAAAVAELMNLAGFVPGGAGPAQRADLSGTIRVVTGQKP